MACSMVISTIRKQCLRCISQIQFRPPISSSFRLFSTQTSSHSNNAHNSSQYWSQSLVDELPRRKASEEKHARSSSVIRFAQRIGLPSDFSSPGLLGRALTHPSYANGSLPDYERLEFLGDSVLTAVSTDYFYHNPRQYSARRLQFLTSFCTSNAALHNVGLRLGVGPALLVGRQVEINDSPGAIADAVEAVIGAIYTASGPTAAREFIIRHILEPVASNPDAVLETLGDWQPRTWLKEMLKFLRRPPARYKLIHVNTDKTKFTVMVYTGAEELGQGTGPSLKEAEEAAARRAVHILRPIASQELASEEK